MNTYIKNLIDNDKEFQEIIYPLITNETVLQMKDFRQHYETSCFEHCYMASYYCFLICKKYNLDYKSITRAAMLHDLFLYDWRHSHKNLNGWHAFEHPKIALENAKTITSLNAKEEDIILKHMWPVTFFKFPKYKESFVITITDKLSAMKSFFEYYQELVYKKKCFRIAYIFFAFTIFKLQ